MSDPFARVPRSLSIHAQCFWVFTPTERRIMAVALDAYVETADGKNYRIAQMLLDALNELSTQD